MHSIQARTLLLHPSRPVSASVETSLLGEAAASAVSAAGYDNFLFAMHRYMPSDGFCSRAVQDLVPRQLYSCCMCCTLPHTQHLLRCYSNINANDCSNSHPNFSLQAWLFKRLGCSE
jgi:hypothetical protein